MNHEHFKTLTTHSPFPWQEALYRRFIAGDAPRAACVPTGLGKTSVIAVWLLALMNPPNRMPRRLVYVVNRRTVVDQTTAEVERLRENLPKLGQPGFETLVISTLRGQFADNREWSTNPSRPAVICGTVDMIGSRLLFSGYGVGFKAKPLHAGFLGQDVLLVHDEAHLEPAFQKLVDAIEAEQKRCNEFSGFRVMELTATTRNGKPNENGVAEAFGLSEEDREHPIVKQRIEAKKHLTLKEVDDDKAVAEQVASLALQHKDTSAAVLVFVRTLNDVKKVCDKLTDKKLGVPKDHVQQLTGTMRGNERDQLVKSNPVFARFMPPSDRSKDVTPAEGTVYLVCTSAGEVGVNLSADHMVCDLSTFDSMAQRLGRVNRFGDRNDTCVNVVYPKEFGKKDKTTGELKAIDKRRQKTLELLKKLPSPGDSQYNASPLALSNLDADDRVAAYAPEPTILPATDILFDAWALTTIRDTMPGRPEVGPYLHGIADELPQTTIAWRAELDLFANDPNPRTKLQAIFTKHRIRPHETVTTNSFRVIEFFKAITAPKRRPDLRDTRVAILFSHQLILTTIGKLIDNPGPLNADPTLVLPASFGYLDDKGMLSADAVPPEPKPGEAPSPPALDIADHEGYEPTSNARPRLRVVIERTDGGWKALPLPGGKPLPDYIILEPVYAKPTGLINDLANRNTGLRVRLVQPIVFDDEGEGDAVKLFVALAPVRRQQQAEEQTLDEHVQAVEAAARAIADKLNLNEPVRSALLFAARWHDEGKKAPIWQRYIGGEEGHPPLGKSAKWCDPKKLSGYRHEFGALLRIPNGEAERYMDAADPAMPPEQQKDACELALHLIAAHHGNARPHFPRTLDKDFTTQQSDQAHTDAIRRFARLQRKYGRWGLAYLESLLRAADYAASAGLDTDDDTEELDGGDE